MGVIEAGYHTDYYRNSEYRSGSKDGYKYQKTVVPKNKYKTRKEFLYRKLQGMNRDMITRTTASPPLRNYPV